MLIGYARVSTDDQKLRLQRDALKQAGCKKLFREKVSGAAKGRDDFGAYLRGRVAWASMLKPERADDWRAPRTSELRKCWSGSGRRSNTDSDVSHEPPHEPRYRAVRRRAGGNRCRGDGRRTERCVPVVRVDAQPNASESWPGSVGMPSSAAKSSAQTTSLANLRCLRDPSRQCAVPRPKGSAQTLTA